MGARPFMDTLRDQRNGALHDDLTEKFQEMVEAVAQERKSGSITITLSLKPNSDGTAYLSDKVTVKKPEPTVRDTLFFVTPENNLHREDPRQTKMTLQALPERDAPRTIDNPPRESVG